MDIRGNDFEMIQFGSGRRICVGMNLDLRMVPLVTGSLVDAFNLPLPDGLKPDELNMDEAYGLTLQRATPLMLHAQPRLAQQDIKHSYWEKVTHFSQFIPNKVKGLIQYEC